MTWRPPWGKAEVRCDWRSANDQRCIVRATFNSNGSHVYDRRKLAETGWTYSSLVGDLCPAHSREGTP